MQIMVEASRTSEAIVIGGGAAGIGAAGALGEQGIKAVVLERGWRVGGSWPDRYRGLRLNTARSLSHQPGKRIPRAAGRWVRREEFVRYLAMLVSEAALDVRLGMEVVRLERADGGWTVETTCGDFAAAVVVVATGYDRVPHVPAWPGREGFEGELLHSSAYRDAAQHAGSDALVIGPGNSGTEIATQLATAGARRVRLAVRTPPNLMPPTTLGVPATWLARASESAPTELVDAGSRLLHRAVFGDLTSLGIPRAPLGIASEHRKRGMGPVLDRGFVAALKRGAIEIVPAVSGFDGAAVELSDGSTIEPDLVIAATGFRHGLEPLAGHLGVLDERGRPLVRDGHADQNAPGLFFNGFWFPLSGQLPGMRRSSRRIAALVAQ
jgi:putative flavoprotein involved in K+ transport